MRLHFIRFGVGAVMCCLAAAPSFAVDPAIATETCRAIDGDTLSCGGRRVRIMGLHAPELRGRCPYESALARRAHQRMTGLIMGGSDLEPHGRDRYGRLLAVVLDRYGRDVALVMIREGLARANRGERRRGWCAP